MLHKLLFVGVLCFFLNSFSQTGIITYKTKKTIHTATSNPELARKITEEVDRSTFTLSYDANKSYFKKDKLIPVHSFAYKLATVFTRSLYEWHQFSNIEKFSGYYVEILRKKYIVDHSAKMKNWELTNEVQIIDGYTCYKAIRKVINDVSGNTTLRIAWYTPEIPVPYGPVGNGGLPGLILKLTYGKKIYYIVDKIVLNPNKKVRIPKLKVGKKITTKELNDLRLKARKVTKD